jgi:hypothetical protein
MRWEEKLMVGFGSASAVRGDVPRERDEAGRIRTEVLDRAVPGSESGWFAGIFGISLPPGPSA